VNRFVPVNVTSLFCSIYDANLSWDLFNKPFLLKGLAIVLWEEELLVFLLLLLLKSIEIISARLGKSFFEELSLKLSFVFPRFICFLLHWCTCDEDNNGFYEKERKSRRRTCIRRGTGA